MQPCHWVAGPKHRALLDCTDMGQPEEQGASSWAFPKSTIGKPRLGGPGRGSLACSRGIQWPQLVRLACTLHPLQHAGGHLPV